MAGATGLEPATSGVTGRRSNQLSYAPSAHDRDGHPYPPRPEVSSREVPVRAGGRGGYARWYGMALPGRAVAA
jgi:hypothetical protein